MAEGDRPDETPPPRARKRRRPPPVLELEAKEVGGGGRTEKAEQPKAEPKPESKTDSKPKAPRPWHEELGAFDWRGLVSNPIIAGGIGIVAGALIVYLLVAPRAIPSDPRVAELAGQVANLSAQIETLAARPPAVVPDTDGLGERIDRLTAAIGEAEQRLAAVEKRPEPQAPDLSGVTERAAAIEAAIKELRATLGDLRKLTEQSPPAATPAAIENLAAKIGGLEQRIASLAAARPVAVPAAPLAVEIAALNALADAVRSGKPFVRELEAARARLGERAAPLAAIEPSAAKGLPTVAELAERFSAIVPQLLREPDSGGGVFSRLFTNAVRLVEIRRVGEPEGTSIDAVIARMETKLSRGDLAGALAEYDALPEAAKAAAASWFAAATQRHDAEATVKALIDAALKNRAERVKP